MNELERTIKAQQMKRYIIFIFIAFFILAGTIISLLTYPVLLVLIVVFTIFIYMSLVKDNLVVLQTLKKIRQLYYRDLDACTELLHTEISFLKDITGATSTEMDIHSFNATNEGKVMEIARSNTKGYQNLLGMYEHLQDIVDKRLKEEVTKTRSILDEF